ncbi:MAG: serine/threonine protein kinase [Planctomycetes bacterium]|nr:serine/threonine protein kinase [Planctomycetota bacterium]
MEAGSFESQSTWSRSAIDWESFYRNYRKPGYVPGFEIVNKLGGGVFGMVFKARKESIGKDYAIKFLKVDDEAVRDAVGRELDSVRLFAQIDHPNLVSIEDKGSVDGIPYIVMSYAGEETLRKRLDAGRLDRDEALRIFIQAARGVQALHEHSLVHFDLKPANIFLKGDIARVGDYGLSKLVTESRNSLSFGRGTPYYMAPEMLKRKGDARSDIYSLGIILYECLTGDVPFRGESEWEVLRKHETEPPCLPEFLGQVECTVLSRCLAKEPDDRFQSVKELLHVLQAPASLGESMRIPPLRPARAGSSQPRPAAASAAAQRPAGVAVPPPLPNVVPAPAAPPRSRSRDESHSEVVPFAPPERGPVGVLVHGLFRALEMLILALLVPLRALAEGVGRLLVWAVKLPFRLLAFAFTMTGYLLLALVVLMLLGGVLTLVAG